MGRAFLRSYDKQRVSAVRVCGPKVGAEAACAEQKAVEALDVSFYALKEGGARGVSRRARANTVCDPADCGSQAMAAIVMWPGGGDGLSQREGGEGILQGIGVGRALCSLPSGDGAKLTATAARPSANAADSAWKSSRCKMGDWDGDRLS